MSDAHPYACTCDKHTRQREYARDLRARKARGEVEYKPRGPQSVRGGTREKQPGSRLVETDSGGGSLVHWMPKEGETWVCPQCQAAFMKIDGEWQIMLGMAS